MTTPAQRGARAELDSARAAVARLDATRGTEDLAADLIDTWRAMEGALRTLVGSTVLSGQALIREARMRQLLNFDQANALAEFQAIHDRVQDTSYRPTEADINAARSAFLRLDTALMSDASPGAIEAPRPSSVPPQSAPASVPTGDVGPIRVVGPPSRFPRWMLATLGIVIVAVLVGGYLMLRGGGETALDQGIAAYRAGQREAAVNAFNRAVREDKNAVLPHVYLARMAREVGNFTLASQELQLALQADQTSAIALREMGANLLAQSNYELARRFYVRAVTADSTDKMAQGYLGCVLMRLNRVSEAMNFMNHAGPGPWSNCTPANTQGQAAGQIAAPGSIPR